MKVKEKTKVIILILLGILALAIIFIGQKNFVSNKQTTGLIQQPTQEQQEKFSQDKIFVYSLKGKTNVYIKGSVQDSNKYIGYHIQYFEREVNRKSAVSNYKVYKLESAAEYSRTPQDKFILEKNVVRTGEWEMAIKEKGANDFVGGNSHGDEVDTSVQIFVDGKEVEFGGFINTEADEYKLVTVSDIYRDNTITTDLEVIGTHKKTYIFNKDGLTLDQEVTFNQDMELETSYLTMLPIYRADDEGRQVTDTAYIGDEGIEIDVAEEGFEREYYETNKAVITGETSGITATVEILDKGSEIPTLLFVSNSPLYNKIYFSYVQNGYHVTENEVWSQTSHYKINTIN